MKFGYKYLGGGYERPIIPIRLRDTNGDDLHHEALIDSGADMCLFDAQLGELLGLDVESGKRHEVAGVVARETRSYYVHEIEYKIGNQKFLAKVGFMHDFAKTGHGILGQNGFFDRVKFVKFEKVKGVIEIGPKIRT